MINGEKIGVGLVSCTRPDMYNKLITSLVQCESVIDRLYVVEDTIENREIEKGVLNHNEYALSLMRGLFSGRVSWGGFGAGENIGVAKAKNICLKDLMDDGCDHIFLIEDDIYIKDPLVFEKYIQASKVSGIQHFNFSQHGMMNKTFDGSKTPNPRLIIDYKSSQIALYPHCVGAFSYYSRKCLEDVGLLDERYYNACEHVDHTYEIIKKGYHPPFWYFADIDKSWEYLGDEEWSLANSTISSNPNHKQMMNDADKIFVKKHGRLPGQIVLTSEDSVVKSLKEIKKAYGFDPTNV